LADAGTGCGRAGPELSVNRGEPRRADSGGWRVAPLTCAVDGLAHVVSDEAAAAGIADRSGTYTALCGHRVHAAALICASGKPCPQCAQQVEASLASVPRQATVRRGWQVRLRRLLGRASTSMRPGH
jgi:hypothetical protein